MRVCGETRGASAALPAVLLLVGRGILAKPRAGAVIT